MLIDDHFSMGVIFRTMLIAMGCDPGDFDFCQDVESAVSALQSRPPYQIIFLDHFVPPTYHFRESLAMLKALDEQTSIVLLSGEIPEDFGAESVDSRIQACLEKDMLSAERLYSLLKSMG